MAGMPLLLAIVAVQFGVHAIGWLMTSAMRDRWRGPEAHFAAFWLIVSLVLALHLLPVGVTHPLRLLADALAVIALLVVYRGLQRFYRVSRGNRVVGMLALLTLIVFAAIPDSAIGARLAEILLTLAVAMGTVALAVLLVGKAETSATRVSAFALGAVFMLVAASLLWRALGLLDMAWLPQAQIQEHDLDDLSLGLVLLVAGGLFNLVQIQLALGRYFLRLVHQSRHDDLTGLINRRGFVSALEQEHRRLQRDGDVYALLMVDVDHFKQVNDQYGHAVGDAVLSRVAARLAATARAVDAVGRIGGEEFCLLLPATGADGARTLAQRICEEMHGEAMLPAIPTLRVTVSVGIACAAMTEVNWEAVLRRADRALYRAKAAGRDCVVMDDTVPS